MAPLRQQAARLGGVLTCALLSLHRCIVHHPPLPLFLGPVPGFDRELAVLVNHSSIGPLLERINPCRRAGRGVRQRPEYRRFLMRTLLKSNTVEEPRAGGELRCACGVCVPHRATAPRPLSRCLGGLERFSSHDRRPVPRSLAAIFAALSAESGSYPRALRSVAGVGSEFRKSASRIELSIGASRLVPPAGRMRSDRSSIHSNPTPIPSCTRAKHGRVKQRKAAEDVGGRC